MPNQHPKPVATAANSLQLTSPGFSILLHLQPKPPKRMQTPTLCNCNCGFDC
jgi:hypothetical protein